MGWKTTEVWSLTINLFQTCKLRVATEAQLLYRGGLSLVVKDSDTNVKKDKRDKL